MDYWCGARWPEDRGAQYAAAAFAQLASTHGITLSMSRTANPYDNALATA